jgi:L-ascorbate metabolism protein UlaG (beta-lactamase superfamily)
MELLPVMGKAPSGRRLERIKLSPHYADGKFQNKVPTELLRKGAPFFKVLWLFFNKPKDTVPPAALPSVRTDLRNLPDGAPVVVWFGHSSYLIKAGGKHILVDPVFSGHASPVSFFARAFKGTNVYGVSDLPKIDMVVITHDHYDHLDYRVMKQLTATAGHFYTSLGVGAHLEYWGIGTERITELDWGEEVRLDKREEIPADSGTLTATTARHFSGRGMGNGRTLWSSFVLKIGGYSFFLGGDSGYAPHFKAIGEQFGPFDIAILECGQYGKYWPDIHMRPEETVAAAGDLGAKLLLPVHWGKFSLSLHPWDEPVRRALAAARKTGLAVTTPLIGEPVIIGGKVPQREWWEEVSPV